MIGPVHAEFLAKAIVNRLGKPSSGAVAFLRCFPSEQIDALADSDAFVVPGWAVNAVIDVAGTRRMSADQAVEQREDKAGASLLLVDPLRAGAGLDGIYSAGREIGEAELFGEALKLARRKFFGRMAVLDEAIRRAERLGRRRRLTPWSKFDYYVSAADDPGGALARLGLWPVATKGDPSTSELDMSAELADRLLYVSDTRAIAERVRALQLDDAGSRGPALERALRAVSGMSPEEAARCIEEQPDLWLGALRPGFANEEVRRIILTSWRDTKGAVLKWSGLGKSGDEDTTPRLVLDRAATAKDRAQLTVRWSSDPEGLVAGSIDYRVSVIAGEDVLAERVVRHRDHRTQQVAITLDDFEDLEGTEKFDAVVEVAAIGFEHVAPVQSEPFTLEFGQMAKPLTSASGQEVRTLVEGAIGVGDRAAFERMLAGPGAAERPVEDRRGFLTWKGEAATKGARVHRPALLRSMEKDWAARGGTIGHWVQIVRADGSPIGGLEFVELEPADQSVTTERAREASRKLTGELIALALMHAHCVAAGEQRGPWLNVEQGVLIPVDEIADHAPIVQMAVEEGESARRADFIHVSAPPRGPLEFRFVEVKYRQHLRTARQLDMLTHMVRQTSELRDGWMNWFFADSLAPLDRVVRRAQLARLMRFYVDRAGRHRLSPRAYTRLGSEIDQMVTKVGYVPGIVADPDVGYVFCPEHRSGQVERIYSERSETALWLFGPTMLPDEVGVSAGRMMLPTVPEAAAVSAMAGYDEGAARSSPPTDGPVEGDLAVGGPSGPGPRDSAATDTRPVSVAATPPAGLSGPEGTKPAIDGTLATPQQSSLRTPSLARDPVEIPLGETLTHVPVNWLVSIRTNPHLMMVGLPGMGKTTALINIAKQLASADIIPVIFSYHDDIDEKLTRVLGPLRTVDFDGLGFNPLRVDAPGPTAYIDVAGTLRDIFASIFPDLGEIQLEELRGAIKQSYDDLGWNDRGGDRPDPPRFKTFIDILRSRPKPNQNLLARLQELTDYGFFDGEDGAVSIIMDRRPTLVRVHLSTNDIVQRAFSAFVLYSIYKDMFRRGVQDCLTHAVIFDEAHRAAKLKLIPRFAKECRKYGLALALASQGIRDFDGALFEAVASYLVLRVTEADARALARNTGAAAEQQRTTDRLKALEPYHAMFFTASNVKPTTLRLTAS